MEGGSCAQMYSYTTYIGHDIPKHKYNLKQLLIETAK
jgi:hypothetical protein